MDDRLDLAWRSISQFVDCCCRPDGEGSSDCVATAGPEQ